MLVGYPVGHLWSTRIGPKTTPNSLSAHAHALIGSPAPSRVRICRRWRCGHPLASGLLAGGCGRAGDAELRRLIYTLKMPRAHRRGVLSASFLIPTGTCLGSATSLCFRCFLAALVEARNDERAPLVVSWALSTFLKSGQSCLSCH